jgi:hypothetical protein
MIGVVLTVEDENWAGRLRIGGREPAATPTGGYFQRRRDDGSETLQGQGTPYAWETESRLIASHQPTQRNYRLLTARDSSFEPPP